MRGSVVATRIAAVIPFFAHVAMRIILILRMILVAITSKLPCGADYTSARAARARRASASRAPRVLRAAKRKAILLLITE